VLNTEKAVKVSLYLGNGSSNDDTSAYSRILDFLFYRGVSGATVIRGVAGFGGDHHIHSFGMAHAPEHLPLKVEFLESQEKVNMILGKLEDLVGTGMIEIEETTVARPAGASMADGFIPMHRRNPSGQACMMQIWMSDDRRGADKPAHELLVEAMKAHNIAGVTVYRGILGYGFGDQRPIVLSLVDTEAKLRSLLPTIEETVPDCLLTISSLEIVCGDLDAGGLLPAEDVASVENAKP